MREFNCAYCKGTYRTDTPVEKAKEEYDINFNDPVKDDLVSLCDDCYEMFWQWAKINAPELKRSV